MRCVGLALASVACWFLSGTHPATAADANGVEVHVPMLSETGRPGSVPHALALGGPDNAKVVLRLNIDDVRHVLLRPDDLRDASITIKVAGKAAVGDRLVLYRLLRDVEPEGLASTPTVAPEAVAQATLNEREPGLVSLHGSLARVLADDLKDPSQDHGLLLAVESAGGESRSVPNLELLPTPTATEGEGTSHVASLSITIQRYPNAWLFTQPVRPRPGVYAQVVDGHITYGGQRLRLWGVCRHFWGGEPVLDRLDQMGFNAIRLWGPRNAYDVQSARQGVMGPEGSLENEDSLATFDKFFADAKKRGFFIWMEGFHYDPLGIMGKGDSNALDGVTADDSFLVQKFGDGRDWNEWKKALVTFAHSSKGGRVPHTISLLTYFDPRLREIYRRQVINLLNHVNPYTGKRYTEDESVAVWGLANEEGMPMLPLAYGQGDWPQYFKAEIQSQWCQWLLKRYHNDNGLRQAWGELRPGESIEGATVKIEPLERNRADYPAARAADVVHFFCDVTTSFNQEMQSLCHAQAPRGVGSAVVPVVYDTQTFADAPWLYCDSLADAISFGLYQFTFHSSLTVPPRLVDMDDNNVRGKPTLIYETEGMRPGPFRAEFPLRLLALASWQDWDGVFWHYWKGMGSQPDEGYDAAPLDLPRKGYINGGIYPDEDPAMCASLSMAGQAFLAGAIAPAREPAIYSIPLKTVYGYDDFNGINMRHDTFTRGAYATFSTTDSGAPPRGSWEFKSYEPYPQGAVQCGPQITYDWPNGRMMIDTPTFKAYVGQPHGAYRFSDGIVLEGVSTPFVAFGLLSADGKPLAGGGDVARRMYVTAKFDSQNTGFRMDLDDPRQGESSNWDEGWNNTFAAAIKSAGRAPVITDQVKYQLSFPQELSGQVSGYDFALREMSQEKIEGNSVQPRDGYMSLIQVDSRGRAMATAQSSAPRPDDPIAPAASEPLERPDPAMASLFMPLPLIGWGEGYGAVYESLKDSTIMYSSISKPEEADEQNTISLKDADAILERPADLELTFANRRLSQIEAVFSKSAPSLDAFIKAYGGVLGVPSHASNTEVVWTQKQGDASLTVRGKRDQSGLAVTFSVAR
jgi:hypothetical protein